MGNVKESISRRTSPLQEVTLPASGIILFPKAGWGNKSPVFITYSSDYKRLEDIGAALNHILANGFCWSDRPNDILDLDQYALPITLREERAFKRQGIQPIVDREDDIKPKVRKKRQARFVPSNISDPEVDQDPEIFTYKESTYDPRKRILNLPTASNIQLTPRKGRLIRLFMKNPGEKLENSWLINKVWGRDDVDDQMLRVLVREVRKKVGDQSLTWNTYQYINSVKDGSGLIGYRFDIPEARDLPNL